MSQGVKVIGVASEELKGFLKRNDGKVVLNQNVASLFTKEDQVRLGSPHMALGLVVIRAQMKRCVR